VVDLNAALGQQLLYVAVRQPEPQVSANCHDDHLGRKLTPSERRTRTYGASDRTD
jgi:hypothetical protein